MPAPGTCEINKQGIDCRGDFTPAARQEVQKEIGQMRLVCNPVTAQYEFVCSVDNIPAGQDPKVMEALVAGYIQSAMQRRIPNTVATNTPEAAAETLTPIQLQTGEMKTTSTFSDAILPGVLVALFLGGSGAVAVKAWKNRSRTFRTDPGNSPVYKPTPPEPTGLAKNVEAITDEMKQETRRSANRLERRAKAAARRADIERKLADEDLIRQGKNPLADWRTGWHTFGIQPDDEVTKPVNVTKRTQQRIDVAKQARQDSGLGEHGLLPFGRWQWLRRNRQ